MKTQNHLNFYQGFQTLEDIEKEIQNELKELENLNKVSKKIITPTKQYSKKIIQKEELKNKTNNIKNPNKTEKIKKSSNKNLKNQDFDESLYERLEKCVQNPHIPKNDQSLLDDIENHEVPFLKNNMMPHEIEYTNPQIKNFYNPRIKVLQARNTKDNDSQIQKKNIQSSKLNQNENDRNNFKPMLLKKSLLIAEKMGDAMSRLTKGSISKNHEKISQLNSDMYGRFNFKPEINKVSEKLVQKKRREKSNEKLGTSNKPRWEELYSMYNEKNKENEVKKLENEIKKYDDPNLTFHPQLLKNHYIFYGDNDMDLIERNKYWKNKMDEKIQTQRKSMEGRDLEFCTFKPNISKTTIKHSHSSNEILNPPTNFNKMGIVQHFERIDQAKKKKKEKETILNKFNGNGWKNKITIPKEYTPHPTDKELLRKKKNTEFSEFYNQILTKNNKSVSFTNFNLTKTSWDLSETEEDITLNKNKVNFENVVNALHHELHNLKL